MFGERRESKGIYATARRRYIEFRVLLVFNTEGLICFKSL